MPSKELAFQLYSDNISLGWRVIKRITFEAGESKVAAGTAVRVYDELGEHIGYQLVRVFDQKLPAGNPSPCALTAQESALNAGLHGRSRTRGMNEERRVKRFKRGQTMEDPAERAQAKVAAYTASSNAQGDRAVRVYPKC